MDVLQCSCMGKDIQRGGSRIIKRSLVCIRTWRNKGPLEPRLKIQSGREQHEHRYWKRACCILWTEIPVPVYRSLQLQKQDLGQHCILQGEPLHLFYTQTVKFSRQMITHETSRLNSGLLTKVRQTCTLSVSCFSVMK